MTDSATSKPGLGCLFGMAFAIIIGLALIMGAINAVPVGITVVLPMIMAMSAVYGNPIGVGWIACALLVAFSMFICREFLAETPAFLIPVFLSCIVVVIDALLRRHYKQLKERQYNDDNARETNG